MIEVTTTHLQQLSPEGILPSSRPLPAGARIERVAEITPEFSKFLYRGVGSGWNWSDRLSLTRTEWESLVRTPGVETHVLYVDGAPGGYVELAGRVQDSGTEVEIMYFGLFPQCIGRGLGGALLTEGISRAWDLDSRFEGFPPVSRVWVHTCSLDGPAAIANYEARGLRIFHTETEMVEPGDGAAGLWPADSVTA
ncbi:GNAT family acetyltransferase [Paeniglutamicibacter sp. MACA_103]|uniref:GNAT family acetyltransferase n=1 Tax=Paeniglutamicibacter sp. MACA_103 TaxID=3377337 RepID=UPI0038957697